MTRLFYDGQNTLCVACEVSECYGSCPRVMRLVSTTREGLCSICPNRVETGAEYLPVRCDRKKGGYMYGLHCSLLGYGSNYDKNMGRVGTTSDLPKKTWDELGKTTICLKCQGRGYAGNAQGTDCEACKGTGKQ